MCVESHNCRNTTSFASIIFVIFCYICYFHFSTLFFYQEKLGIIFIFEWFGTLKEFFLFFYLFICYTHSFIHLFICIFIYLFIYLLHHCCPTSAIASLQNTALHSSFPGFCFTIPSAMTIILLYNTSRIYIQSNKYLLQIRFLRCTGCKSKKAII